jgi:hypothetical protein
MVIKNPKRSGGPRSAEGKLAVSQNALKTGTYSNLPILPHENQEEFNQLIDQFNHDFHPADIIETTLVRELAVLTWKKLRLEKLENEYFIKRTNAPISLEDLIDSGIKFNQVRFDFWDGLKFFDNKKIEDARNVLAYLKPILYSEITPEQLQEVKSLNSLIYDNIVNIYRNVVPTAGADISDAELVIKMASYPDQPKRLITSMVFEKFIGFYQAGFWCTERQSEIEQAVLQIKQERILGIMQSDNTRRANDDLSRAFMRTLEQFRKHHQWRMQHRVFDTEEE